MMGYPTNHPLHKILFTENTRKILITREFHQKNKAIRLLDPTRYSCVRAWRPAVAQFSENSACFSLFILSRICFACYEKMAQSLSLAPFKLSQTAMGGDTIDIRDQRAFVLSLARLPARR
jgi:hypothetical protein